MTTTTHGIVEIDDSGPAVRIRFALPQEWFTAEELRAFAAYLTLLADDAEPSPELEKLTGILETARMVAETPRGTARAILRAGYVLTECAATPEAAPTPAPPDEP